MSEFDEESDGRYPRSLPLWMRWYRRIFEDVSDIVEGLRRFYLNVLALSLIT